MKDHEFLLSKKGWSSIASTIAIIVLLSATINVLSKYREKENTRYYQQKVAAFIKSAKQATDNLDEITIDYLDNYWRCRLDGECLDENNSYIESSNDTLAIHKRWLFYTKKKTFLRIDSLRKDMVRSLSEIQSVTTQSLI